MDYQIGVFVSRSSVNVVKINQIWLMSVFQLVNVAILLTEVITFFSPSIWIIFGVVFWEGLLGGGAYVNTFYRMSKEIPKHQRKFALGVVTVADAIGIGLAGVFAIPAHNALCKMPMPIRNWIKIHSVWIRVDKRFQHLYFTTKYVEWKIWG